MALVEGKVIATSNFRLLFLFLQLNDVTAGGATVFLKLNITIPVEKVCFTSYLINICLQLELRAQNHYFVLDQTISQGEKLMLRIQVNI